MINDEYNNGIYELTDEDKEMIPEHNLFYADMFSYLNTILDNGFQETMPDYELTIYSMIYRITELLDTLKVMTENSLINSGFIVLRSLIEISVQLCYILSDDSKVKEKAIILQLLDVKRTAKDETVFYEEISKIECYKDYVPKIRREKPFSNWYSYCEGKRTSLEDLFRITHLEGLYSELYRPLCIETHEINHMETNIVWENNKFNFKPFRVFENHVLLMDSILTVMVPSLHRLVKKYGNDDLRTEWTKYEKKVIDYVDSNNRISQIQKIFNPRTKWFKKEELM